MACQWEKIDFKTKTVTGDRGYYIMIKGNSYKKT